MNVALNVIKQTHVDQELVTLTEHYSIFIFIHKGEHRGFIYMLLLKVELTVNAPEIDFNEYQIHRKNYNIFF